MAIKSILDKLEDAPEILREHYRQTEDGKFVADVSEDHPLKRKISELLEGRKTLKAQLDETAKRYEGFDPEEHKRLRLELDEVKSGKGETFGRLVSAEKQRLQEEYSRKLADTARARDEAKTKSDQYRVGLSRRLLADEFRRVLTKEKVKLRSEGAFEDLMSRAGLYFEADPDSGKVRAREADSLEEAKSAAEWLKDRLRDPLDAHIFDDAVGSAGSGAGAGRRLANGKVMLTQRQLSQPSPEEFKIIQSGNFEIAE